MKGRYQTASRLLQKINGEKRKKTRQEKSERAKVKATKEKLKIKDLKQKLKDKK